MRFNTGVRVTLQFFEQEDLFQDFKILSRPMGPEPQDGQNKMRNMTLTRVFYTTSEERGVPVTHTQQRLCEFIARTESSWEAFL